MTNRVEGEFLVLHRDVTHKDFKKFAKKNGLKWVKTYEQSEDDVLFDDIWSTKDRESLIHYIDDPIMEIKYVWVQGKDLLDLVVEIVNKLPVYDSDEQLSIALDENLEHDDIVDILFCLAIAFPNFHPDVLNVFKHYLENHPNPMLRKATIHAIGARYWEQSIPLLTKIARNDAEQEVRDFALEILQEHGDA